MIEDERDFYCPYKTYCPDYKLSIECDTHLHTNCYNFTLQYEADKFLERLRENEGLEQEVKEQ